MIPALAVQELLLQVNSVRNAGPAVATLRRLVDSDVPIGLGCVDTARQAFGVRPQYLYAPVAIRQLAKLASEGASWETIKEDWSRRACQLQVELGPYELEVLKNRVSESFVRSVVQIQRVNAELALRGVQETRRRSQEEGKVLESEDLRKAKNTFRSVPSKFGFWRSWWLRELALAARPDASLKDVPGPSPEAPMAQFEAIQKRTKYSGGLSLAIDCGSGIGEEYTFSGKRPEGNDLVDILIAASVPDREAILVTEERLWRRLAPKRVTNLVGVSSFDPVSASGGLQ